ncbi:MAG: amidohydrolase family protein [Rhodothalassiaceae bacterium]
MSATGRIHIRNALLFDGEGGPPVPADLAISDGLIERILAPGTLPEAGADTIEAEGLWLIPGLLDIHTHFDLEVEIAPELPEAVRHGTTTVVVGNCSLGLAYGNLRTGDDDPVVSCFARVENIPKPILSKVADRATWHESGAYLAHLDALPLGPNIVPLVPHSMLRIRVMGLADSISRDPTEAELTEMERLLETAMEEGYAGFSTDALPFHYLANRPYERHRIPAQYGSHRELRRLTAVLRRHDRLWQATPPKDSPLSVFRTFLLTSGRLYGRPLRLTAVAALDVATNRGLVGLARRLTRLLNSRAIDGHFRLQALAAPFKVWAEGPLTPLAEEIPELRLLNEPDLEDRAARRAILDDPSWQAAFRSMWHHGKKGLSLARIKRLLRRENYAIDRDLAQMTLESCPVPGWAGMTLADLRRHVAERAGDPAAIADEEERAAVLALAPAKDDEADFLIGLLRLFDTDLVWSMISANREPSIVRDLLFDPVMLPGFNDSGAHLTNMAFYDGNLRALRIAAAEGLAAAAHMVQRLTAEPADFFGIAAGRIAPGARADLALIDPGALARWRPEETIERIRRAEFGHHQLVNRPKDVVRATIVGGRIIWREGQLSDEAGHRRFGRCLRARNHERAAMAAE